MTDHNQHPEALLPKVCHKRHHFIAVINLSSKCCMLQAWAARCETWLLNGLRPKGVVVSLSVHACFKGGIPVQVAAWERWAWQSVSVQIDEGTHRPQSLSASPPEAVLLADK